MLADVPIAGAGPTGLTLALALHRRGIAVRALEKRAGVAVRCEDGSSHRARYAVGCGGSSGAVRGLAGIRAGRVLLAGDAVHLTNTRGGMSMNAGIHDVMTLAATLDATLRGAEDRLLDRWTASRLATVQGALLPRTDARVAADPAGEVARMAALPPAAALAWAREASMLDIAKAGMPA